MNTEAFSIYCHKNQAVQDAYSMLTANIYVSAGAREMKTIALTSCKPSVGKTTIAINLALAMADSGWKVLLVDADIRKPYEAKRLNAGIEYGLSDYLVGEAELEKAISRTNIPGFSYLSCGRNRHNPIELLCSARFEEFVHNIRYKYDFILFDTPSLDSVIDAALVASKVDGTLLVAKNEETTLKSLKRAKERLDMSNAKIVGVVLNNVRKREYRKYFESYNYFFDSERFIKKKYKVMNSYIPEKRT